jgi:hypothetical protein
MNIAAARVASEPKASFRKRCGVCTRAYAADTWEKLPMVDTVPPASVQTHLTVSAGWGIELRSCACGAVLAARR